MSSRRAVLRLNLTRLDVQNKRNFTSGGSQLTDDAEGWRYEEQALDWQGRPLRVTNTDGTFRDFLYEGCGCAGGQVSVSRDEVGRRRKSVSDLLGRVTKVQDLTVQHKADALSYAADGGDVYRTAASLYNMRDQVVETQTHASAVEPDPHKIQKTVRGYDGHGRLESSQAPVQARATTYHYHPDDTLWKVLTPRELAGAAPHEVTSTFSYDNRHLLRRVEYTVPAGLTAVQATAPVEYDYDAVGNRLSMTDGSGRTDYHYDALSRLSSEARQFAGLPGTYTLSYAYNLAGGLKSITEGGTIIEYEYDHAGQMKAVNGLGTLYGGVASYAGGVQYRAWGAVKSMNYGNGLKLSAKYNARLLPEEFKVDGKPPIFQFPEAIHKQYRYHADGRLYFSDDKMDDNFDRITTYDHACRLAGATAGYTASMLGNGTPGNAQFDPYSQSYGYDAWDNLSGRGGVYWNQVEQQEVYTATYDGNNRQVGVPYDAAGNALHSSEGSYKFDAAGRNREAGAGGLIFIHTHDGDDAVARRVVWREFPSQVQTTYYLKSSALGGRVVAALSASGQKLRGYVYAGGELLAEQGGNSVRWSHQDPHGGSSQKWDQHLTLSEQLEADPTGVDVGASNPFTGGAGEPDLGGGQLSLVPEDPGGRCRHDGVAFYCGRLGPMLALGSAVLAPAETFRALRFRNLETGAVRRVLGRYYSRGGYRGYVPVGVGEVRGGPAEYTFRFGDGAAALGRIASGPPGGGAGGGGAFFTSVGPPQNPAVVPPSKSIPDLIGDLLKRGDCADYVQKLLNKANELFAGKYPHVNTISEAIDKISKAGGYQLDAKSYHTVSGDLFYTGGGARPGKVHIIPFRAFGTPSASTVAYAQEYYAIAGLHETFHLARQGGYNDEQMARTAYALAGKELPKPPDGVTGYGAASFFSGHFDNELLRHCPKS